MRSVKRILSVTSCLESLVLCLVSCVFLGPGSGAHLDGTVQVPKSKGVLRSVGLGLITGAADDDPSAIGTYATAGAALGPSFLWTAPVTLPMMFVVVYLSAKIGQVSGRGLFDVLANRYPRWLLNAALTGVMIGNTIEAAADIGGIAAAV